VTDERKQRTGAYATRLQRWMHANRVTLREIAAASGMSRQWLTKLRWTERGERNVGLRTMKHVLWAARRVRGPHVQMSDLFDLEPDDGAGGARS